MLDGGRAEGYLANLFNAGQYPWPSLFITVCPCDQGHFVWVRICVIFRHQPEGCVGGSYREVQVLVAHVGCLGVASGCHRRKDEVGYGEERLI